MLIGLNLLPTETKARALTNYYNIMDSASYRETFGPTPVEVPAVDLLTYTFENGKHYDKTQVRNMLLLYFLIRCKPD